MQLKKRKTCIINKKWKKSEEFLFVNRKVNTNLFEQTKTRQKETSEIKLTHTKETFSFNKGLNLKQCIWIIRVLGSEAIKTLYTF